jgi:BRCA1-associated protein
MQGYHIRIVLHLKASQPTSKSSSSSNISDTFIPRSLFQQLPAQTPKHTARRNALINPKHKDYRYGPVRVDWIDFENMNTVVLGGKEKAQGRGK